MGNTLYFIALFLIVEWLIGFFVFQAGSFIHLLLIIAIILVLVKVIQGRKVL